MGNIVFKTDLLRGAKGEKGDAGTTESVPTDGVLAYVGETTPTGYEEIPVSDVFTDIYADINATKDMISDAYDPTATYAVGDYCIYNNVLYRCNTAIATPEAFAPAKWTVTNVGDEIVNLTGKIERGSVFVISDGVKTFAQLLNDLFTLIDLTRVSYKSCLVIYNDILNITEKENAALGFGMSRLSASGSKVDDIVYLHATNSMIYEYVNGTKNDVSATVLSSNIRMSFYY